MDATHRATTARGARRQAAPVGGQGRDAHQRAIMLRRVRFKWITGVLEPSLAGAAWLVLGVERRPDLFAMGTRSVHRPGRHPEPLNADTPISAVFDQVGGGQLILGAPGAGKTTVLLQLCEELLDRAAKDPSQPIPVVFNLASWSLRRPPLDAWLVDELADGYQVPRHIATSWVEQDSLVPLLDGLDEVADDSRVECVAAINTWREQHGLVPLAVCSRTRELQAVGAALRMEEAVELQPPSDAEVDRYLGYLEATGTPVTDVRTALGSDPELRQLLRSPLRLHVVTLAYHGRPAPALYAHGSLEQRQAWLWDAYIKRMFEQRPLDPACGYTAEQALSWLTWLARELHEHAQTEFHLDRLAPDWLPTAGQQRRVEAVAGLAAGLLYGLILGPAFALIADAFRPRIGLLSGLVSGLVGALALGMVVGLVFGLAGCRIMGVESEQERHSLWSNLRNAPVLRQFRTFRAERTPPNPGGQPPAPHALYAALFGLTAGLVAGIVAGLIQGLAFGLYTALTVGIGSGLALRISSTLAGGLAAAQPAEQMRWSWPRLRAGLAPAASTGIVGGIVFGSIGGMMTGMATALIVAPAFAVILGLLGGLAAGLSGQLRDEKALPNECIRQSARHAVSVGLVAGTLAGLVGGSTSGLAFGLGSGLAAGLGAGLAFAATVAAFFGAGACLQHYAVRAVMVQEGIAPWRYHSFLDAMADRLLLRQSGSAYLFIHRLLRDHFVGGHEKVPTGGHV
jgi:eukaryotic-like serine/threonine-protein kinase